MPVNPLLKLAGTKIVDANGELVMLRGAGLGGWMNMENFITGAPSRSRASLWKPSNTAAGFPGHESQIRDALRKAIGPDDADFFWDKVLKLIGHSFV